MFGQIFIVYGKARTDLTISLPPTPTPLFQSSFHLTSFLLLSFSYRKVKNGTQGNSIQKFQIPQYLRMDWGDILPSQRLSLNENIKF